MFQNINNFRITLAANQPHGYWQAIHSSFPPACSHNFVPIILVLDISKWTHMKLQSINPVFIFQAKFLSSLRLSKFIISLVMHATKIFNETLTSLFGRNSDSHSSYHASRAQNPEHIYGIVGKESSPVSILDGWISTRPWISAKRILYPPCEAVETSRSTKTPNQHHCPLLLARRPVKHPLQKYGAYDSQNASLPNSWLKVETASPWTHETCQTWSF